MKTKFYIVLHTHWDREWYFTTSDSLVLMDKVFKNVINELQMYKDISFCLDGQYSIIDEYLSINPSDEAIIKELVNEKRLFIGPWYTQTDTQLINAESITKNLYYGMNKTIERFGSCMEVGYLPDTFGFCNQMPEIMCQANIDKFIFWRGADFELQNLKPYFMWQSLSGNKNKTINSVNGYGMAKGFNDSQEFVNLTLNEIANKYKNYGIDAEIILPVGNDQFEICPDIIQKASNIKEFDFEVSNYYDAINNIFQNGNFDQTYVGEFRKTAYTRLHKSIGSVRYDIKKSNYVGEQLLLNRVEPLIVFAKKFNIEVSIELVYKAWALLFEGQAHDGICGCVSDEVYNDIMNRNNRVIQIAKSIENRILVELSERLNLTENDILIINQNMDVKEIHKTKIFSNYEKIKLNVKSEIVNSKVVEGTKNALVETPTGNHYEDLNEHYIHEINIFDSIEPMSYKVYEFAEGINDCFKINYLENENLKLRFEDKLILEDKINKQEIVNFISLCYCPNDGDTYDFSPLRGEEELVINFEECEIINNKMVCYCNIDLPKSKVDNLDELINIKFKLKLYIENEIIKCNLEFNNQILSHRIRVKININEKPNNSIASTAYGFQTREVLNGNLPLNWEKHNVEMPIDIETFDGYVTYETNKDYRFVLLSSYGKEYQLIDDSIYLTVLATTGTLGKADLLYRPGRASGDVTKKGHIMIDTPGAQNLGKIEFPFAIVLTKENDNLALYNYVKKYRDTTITYQRQGINKFYHRIDNKVMSYRETSNDVLESLNIKTNAIITNVAINLNGKINVRGISNCEHFITSNFNFNYVDLLGNKKEAPKNKWEIFNIEMEQNEL